MNRLSEIRMRWTPTDQIDLHAPHPHGPRARAGYRRRKVPDLFAEAPSAEDLQLLDRIRQRSAAERQALFAQLVEAGKPLRLNVTPVADAPRPPGPCATWSRPSRRSGGPARASPPGGTR